MRRQYDIGFSEIIRAVLVALLFLQSGLLGTNIVGVCSAIWEVIPGWR